MSYKKAIRLFFGVFIFISISVIGILYYYDPLHIFHKSWLTNDSRISGNMRLQAKGVINNYDFDSIILGTSMMKGTSAGEASRKIGGSFVNISADGSDFYERKLILDYALEKKNLKHVIYSFDTGLDLSLRKGNSRFTLDNFDYLYDNNPLNDLKVYWNIKYMKCLLQFSTSAECIGAKREAVRDDKWFEHIFNTNKKISGIDNWIKKGARGKNVYTRVKKYTDQNKKFDYEKNLESSLSIIDDKLISAVVKNPNTVFHIVFPPYSRFYFTLLMNYSPERYTLYFENLKYLFEKSLVYNNLKVYCLDDLDYTSDLSNYRDMRHYNADLNSIILDYIHKNNYIKNENELNRLISTVNEKNKNYNLEKELDFLKKSFKFRAKIYRKVENNKLIIKGYAFSYRVDRVDLYINNKKSKTYLFRKNMKNYNLYPQYKQKNNYFNIKINDTYKDSENLSLFFKYKNKVIKKVRLKEVKSKYEL